MNLLNSLRRFNAVTGQIAPAVSARVSRRVLMRPRAHAPKAWEADALARAQRVSFRFGLSALRWGERDAPVVLMLHGWEGRPTQFAHFIEPLLRAGRQVVALDAPGHGGSAGDESNAILFTHALLEAAVEIPNLEAVVGHSMGAGAIAYALSLGLSPQRAVLLGGPSSLRSVLEQYADGVNLQPRARTRFFDLVARHTGVHPDEVDIRRLARDYQIPALIVHDRDDALVPFEHGERMASAWSGSELMATEGLGHWRILSDSHVIARATHFLVGSEPLRRVA
ncbi:MAG: alpha/beta hydrolase [Pseudomonadota bacterium]|nr:alpha/beta hydrolase [Pseudomonadota bacterium]